MRISRSLFFSMLALPVLAVPAMGGVDDYPGQTANETAAARAWHDMDDVRLETARYHDLSIAIEDGFVPFALDGGEQPTCFDGPDGGMGVHYVRNVDEEVERNGPEAMVYELTPNGRHRLVAVEYVVPADVVEADTAAGRPQVLGQPLHKHATLPLYVLHAWIWEENPDGMFADFNPRVGACPA